MNKSQVVDAIVKKTSLKKKDAEAALAAFVETVEEALKEGEKVQLIGFGTFAVKNRGERVGVNPKTKEQITIAASKLPSFAAGRALKDLVNN